MAESSSGDAGGSVSPALKQLRDALERAILSSLQLLSDLETELTSVQTQEGITQRKSRAAALIDVKKVANFKRNIQVVILECQLKLRGMRHFVTKLSDLTKGTSLARILTSLQKRLQGEKTELFAPSDVRERATTGDNGHYLGPPSPIPSPTPSPSPLSSSSSHQSAESNGTLSMSPPDTNDLALVLPGGGRKDVGRYSSPIPPTVPPLSAASKQQRAISLESERESTSRLVQQGAKQQAAVSDPDPHPSIPKYPRIDLPQPLPSAVSPRETLSRPNPLAPSQGPGMTPTPQNLPPVAPTPKTPLSLSLNNLAKLTNESPPSSPDSSVHNSGIIKPLPKPPARSESTSSLLSPRGFDFTKKPLPQAPKSPRGGAPSAGPGGPAPGSPSGGPGAQLSPRSMELRASDSNILSPSSEPRGRAMSRSESGLQRPTGLLDLSRVQQQATQAEPQGVTSPKVEPSTDSYVKQTRSGRQALVLKKDDSKDAVLPPTPRSRGKVVLQDDVNIWDEGPDSPANLLLERTVDANTFTIVGGTFNKLVEKLTTPGIDNQDTSFSKVFFYTFQAWATPRALLLKLQQRFAIPAREGAPTGEEAHAVQQRTCFVLKRWIELLQQDFCNAEELQVLATSFTEEMRRAKFGREAEEIEALLAEKTIRLMRKDTGTLKWDLIVKNASQPPPPPKCILSTKIFPDNLLGFLNIDDEEIARQLCLMDWGNYCMIRPRELLGQAWAKGEATTFAPNVLNHINHFNMLSLVCVHMIVQPEVPKDRARIVTKWIGVMRHLRVMNNFSSLMAIVAGLNNSAVLRLKKTIVEVTPESLKLYGEYEALMKSEANYRVYREALRSSTPPCMPYLGVHLQDLTFMDENPDEVNGLINFHKNRLIYSAISELLRCQQVGYNFTSLMQLQTSMRALVTMDLNKLYQISLLREPRDANKASDGKDNTLKKSKTFAGVANVARKVTQEVRKTTKEVRSELERDDPH